MVTHAPAPSPAMDPQHAVPCLVQLSGAHPDRRLALSRPAVVFGSHASCDYRFGADDLAEFHCLMVQTPHGLVVRDCKSPAGTMVNGMAVAETELKDGDHLQLGAVQFRVQLPEGGNSAQRQLLSAERRVERLVRRRARLAQLAWRLRTAAQVQARRAADAERRAAEAAPGAKAGPSENGDVAKLREELLRRREQLDEFRKELEKRESEVMGLQQHVMDQAARVGRGGGGQRSSPAEQAAARKELERLKMNIGRLGQEEAKLLENLSTFRALEAEQRATLSSVQQQLQAQEAKLLPEALLERDQVAQLQRYRVQLATETEKLQQQGEAAKKQAKKLGDEVAALEDELNRLRTERERENEAYAREREIQTAAFNAKRQEMADLAEEKKRFLADRARQLEELAAKDAEVTKKLASLADMEKALARQREAVHTETESWAEQRLNALGQVSEREKEIEALAARLKELRTEEIKLEASIADWNAHAERERKTLEAEVAERRANLDKEMEATKKQLMAEWFERKEDVQQGLIQFRGQAEQLWEEFLSKLRIEAKEFTDSLPKQPLG